MSQMIEVNTAELEGAALDWAVANAVKVWESAHEMFPTMTLDPTFSGVEPRPYPRGEFGSMLMTCVLVPSNPFRQDPQPFCPSISWSQGGPLIDRHRISVIFHDDDSRPCAWTDETAAWSGADALICLCRAIVADKLGNTVQVPAELVTP